VSLSPVSSYELLPAAVGGVDGSPGTWRVKLRDGTEFLWAGFQTGPATLSQEDLQRISRELLGLDLDDVPRAAERELRPYVSNGTPVRSVILHTATPVANHLQADMAYAVTRQHSDDLAAYMETRAVVLAQKGDLVVGRTSAWRAAARLAGVEGVEVPGIEYYYLTHAILRLAADQGPGAPPLRRLIEELRARPATVIRLYLLDRETQLVLLYLKRMAGIEVLYNDASSPEVAEYWKTKAPLHPSAEEAAGLMAGAGSPDATLAAESALSPLRRRLNVTCAVVPGYTVDGRGGARAGVAASLALAARLLRERYGISRGCLKPSAGTSGAGITPGIDLSDTARLGELAGRVCAAREEFVLEAHVTYLTRQVGGQQLMLSPSVHIRHGHPAPGMMLQITKGTHCQGNVYIDEAACRSAGVSPGQYRAVRSGLEALRRGFCQARLSVATAGFDFAVGRVGGSFGDQVLVALQDPNLSSNGAEYLRLFLDDVGARGGPAYGATKMIIPVASLAELTMSAERSAPGDWARVMSAVPGRWGMLACAADSPAAAVELITKWEQEWTGNGLILPMTARCE